jgi:plastocyanin
MNPVKSMKALKALTLSALALAAVLALLLAAACGAAGPRDVEVEVKVEESGLVPEVIRVNQGDTVTLRFESQHTGQVHLHGYDIEETVAPGGMTMMRFTADATGRFKFTFHEGPEDHAGDGPAPTPPAGAAPPPAEEEEPEVGFLEVLPR